MPFTLQETIMISFMSVHSLLVATADLLNREEKILLQLSLSFLMTSGGEDKILQIFVISCENLKQKY